MSLAWGHLREEAVVPGAFEISAKEFAEPAGEFASGNWEAGIQALVTVLASALSGNPVVGAAAGGAARLGYAKILAYSANARMLRAAAVIDEELKTKQLAEDLAATVTAWVTSPDSALATAMDEFREDSRDEFVQLVKLIHNARSDLGDRIGSLEQRLDAGLLLLRDSQLPLELPEAVGADAVLGRLHFAARVQPFVGRDAILAGLRPLLDPGPFKWAAVVGPAGSGKSRLALELCLELRGWSAGFLRPRLSGRWIDSGWAPSVPTLIVVDDLMGGPALDETAALLEWLSRVSRQFEHPVRALLTGRDATELERAADSAGQRGLALKSSRFSVVTLGEVDADCASRIAGRSVPRSELPLKAAIDAELGASSDELPDLVRGLLIREQERWATLVKDDLARSRQCELAFAATLVGGLALGASEVGPALAELLDAHDESHYSKIAGPSPGGRVARALKPDLVAEWFIIDCVRNNRPTLRRRQRIVADLWAHAPTALGTFLIRADDSFHDEDLRRELVEDVSRNADAHRVGQAWGILTAKRALRGCPVDADLEQAHERLAGDAAPVGVAYFWACVADELMEFDPWWELRTVAAAQPHIEPVQRLALSVGARLSNRHRWRMVPLRTLTELYRGARDAHKQLGLDAWAADQLVYCGWQCLDSAFKAQAFTDFGRTPISEWQARLAGAVLADCAAICSTHAGERRLLEALAFELAMAVERSLFPDRVWESNAPHVATMLDALRAGAADYHWSQVALERLSG